MNAAVRSQESGAGSPLAISCSAVPTPHAALQEWRRQTLAEAEAIQARDWPRVEACQQAKQQLQTLLSQSAGASSAGTDPAVRELVSELLVLGARNRDCLSARKAALQSRQVELEAGARNLKRLQRSYVRTGIPCWQSYG